MNRNKNDRVFFWLLLLGVAAAVCYAIVAWLTRDFRFDGGHADRPLMPILLLFTVAGVCWLTAVFLVLRRRKSDECAISGDSSRSKKMLLVVIGLAVLHRVILLPSQPIQEIDYYRYLWDGRVLAAGHNPFRFSPKQIDDWKNAGADREERRQIHQISASSPVVNTVFNRVHHRQVSTVYPPFAQVLFASTSLVTPVSAPLWMHVVILKLALIAFDIGTLVVLVFTLRLLKLPAVWSLAYGWCPLVLKEIANSAHLDSIAIFCTSLGLFALVYFWKRIEANQRPLQLLFASLSTGCLALGVLAKSYPVVLLPVVLGFLASRLRWRAAVPVAVFVLVLLIGYAPFAQLSSTQPSVGPDILSSGNRDAGNSETAPQIASNSPLTGLSKFLTKWEMNDFLFTLVRENLRAPCAAIDRWFVVMPRALRQDICNASSQLFGPFGIPAEIDPSFLLTQALMGLAIAGLSCWFGYRLWRDPDPQQALNAVFLVLAWSWLVSAASNPWYLLWCLPFIVFTKKSSWYVLPIFAFFYYVRFWMEYQVWPDMDAVARAKELFDYGVIWLEFLPFFLLLIGETLWQRRLAATPVVSAEMPDPIPIRKFSRKRKSKRDKKERVPSRRKSA